MESHPVQTACCLSDVLDGIAVSAKTPTSLRKSLAFRAVELSLRFAPRGRTQERVVEQDVLPLKEEIAEVMSFTPLKRGVEQATVPQFLEDTVEVLLAPKETTDCRAGAQCLNFWKKQSRWQVGPARTIATVDCRCASVGPE